MGSMIITPKTKIYDLLEAYPQLEETLISIAPQFKKLRNPVLRKTIARVTSISQAAAIGGIKVEELVNTLRNAAGQQLMKDSTVEESSYNTIRPEWYSEDRISQTIDISEMLDAGEQPVHEVLSSLKKLKDNDILKVEAPFLPAPLIDKAAGLGYKYWVNKISENNIEVYFRSKNQDL